MPKCAGTSIKKILELESSVKLKLDYESFFRIPKAEREKEILRCLNDPIIVDDDQVVYGHFFPVKYIGNRRPNGLKLVTIIRDPLSRLISHYNFWSNSDFSDHYLWRKMKKNNWTLSEFIMSDEMKNFYSQYFSQTPVRLFSYIGIYENLNESVNQCFAELGLKGNSSNLSMTNRSELKKEISLSESFVIEAKKFHSKDYVIYNYALQEFHSHISQDLQAP